MITKETNTMRFTKMHGCGNDYVYVNCFEETVSDPSSLAVKLADRHYGIGGDGLILIEPSDKADAYMHMFNLDGSEGNMCGNGIRCVAKYISDHGIVPADRDTVTVDTKSGVKTIELTKENGKVIRATVDMGVARPDSEMPEKITVAGMDLLFYGIDLGNPHAVYFLEDNDVLMSTIEKCGDLLPSLPLEKIGPAFESHPRFPDKVNSEFIDIVSRQEVNFRVWERGSGETLACGTGASAAAAAGFLAGKLDSEVLIHLVGGDLRIRYDEESGHCFMTGPATEVFSGDIDPDEL